MTDRLRVLFVCTANICRSPFMELYARHLTGDGLVVSSAGTHGFTAEAMAPEMAAELAGRGVDTGSFRSRRLTRGMVQDADLVLTAERLHRRFILDDHPSAFGRVLTVGQAARAADSVPPDVRGGRGVLSELARLRGPDDAGSDVSDPYGRGPAAAARAAERITAMLDQLLPVLSPTIPVRKSPHA